MLDQRLATRVEDFVSRLKRESVCMHGFILDVRGEVKATAYYPPFEEGEAHRMYSVSKSMTALAIGLLLDEGKISLDDRIADYFRDFLPEKPDARLMRLKIRDMLRMATCYRATVYRETDDDWTKPFFTAASTHEPGTVFHYDTGCSQVLAALVARLTGQDPARVFKTLVTQGADRNYYVFVVPVLAELDLKKAAKSVGEKSVAMIHVADINKVTGYIRGGCSPVGMKKQFVTVLDESILAQPTVMVSGGRIGTQVELAPADLIKAARATTAAITMA